MCRVSDTHRQNQQRSCVCHSSCTRGEGQRQHGGTTTSRATVQCTALNAMASIHAPSVSENNRQGLSIGKTDQRDQSEAHRAVTQRLDSPCTVDRRVTEAMRFGTASNTMLAIFRVVHDL